MWSGVDTGISVEVFADTVTADGGAIVDVTKIER